MRLEISESGCELRHLGSSLVIQMIGPEFSEQVFRDRNHDTSV